MRPHGGPERLLAGAGVLLATLVVGIGLPLAGSVLAQTPGTAPSPGPSAATPVPGPTGSASPGPSPSPTIAPGAASLTDTEYLNVQIGPDGTPGDAILKDWIRVRGAAGSRVVVADPALLSGPRAVSGSPSPDIDDHVYTWNLGLPAAQYRDLYYEGRVFRQGTSYVSAAGPRALPIDVAIKYYTGAPGAETEVTADQFAHARGAAKIVVEVTNNTRQMQEVSYTDVKSGAQQTAVVPVWTPYVVKIGPLRFPDDKFDQVQTDGQVTRGDGYSEVTWTLNLAPPDYPATQTAIAQFLVAQPGTPDWRIVGQPQYPPAQAEAVSSEGIEFQKGRRSFLYDVFDLLRSNLISLTGLFGLLDDAFSNLAIPLISPEKNNREAGSFDDPNQLWALWTLAKGMEQLDRATNVLDYSLQLSRAAVGGQLATLSQMRLLLGKSTDKAAIDPLAPLICPNPPACSASQLATVIDRTLTGSLWQNLKDLEATMGCVECIQDPNTFLPEAPTTLMTTQPQAAAVLSVIRLKMALMEQTLAALQTENHRNQIATFTGVSDTDESTLANDWRKYTTITFPFGLTELSDGLYQLKVKGIDLIQQALGNKDTPNSIIWAMHVLTDGMESLSDSFHNLGSTWRYLADSIQNFGIFGVETAQNTLQLDINAIDIESGQRAAAAGRVTQQPTTFMGSPVTTKKLPVNTQFVVSFTTDEPELTSTSPLASTWGKIATGFAFVLVIGTLLAFARFRWFLI